jgi:prepilin-type N-terminal cleavage/methylation domain-containing protein
MTANPKLRALRQQAGYTLVELSISVAIISVLVVTSLVGVPRILDANRISTIVQQVSIANSNYSNLASATSGNNSFATTPAYVITTPLALAGMSVWPDTNIQRSATNVAWALTHPWGGNIYSRNVSVALGSYLSANGGYILKLEGIPSRSCFATVSAFGSTALQITLEAGTAPSVGPITSTEIVPSGITPKAAGQTINFGTLATGCETNPGAPKNIYLWFAY